jgi:hypothetical protein
MRIIAKVSTAGIAGLSRFPVPNAEIEDCLTPDGRLDESKARAALNVDQVQFSSADDIRSIAFAFEYLKQTRSVVERLAARVNEDGDCEAVVEEVPHVPDVRTESSTDSDRRCERNMAKGRFCYVRTDIAARERGIVARLSVANPREVAGAAERFARDYALMCARILLYLRENISTTPVILVEGDGAQGIFAEAAGMDRACDLAKLREKCPNRVNGCYCSPINPVCPLYANGKCKDPMKEEA